MLKDRVRHMRLLGLKNRSDTDGTKRDDSELTGLRRAAEQAQSHRDWPRARDLWRQVVEKEPAFLGGWLQLGNMRNECAEYPAALQAFAVAARLDSASFEARAGQAGVHERAGAWAEALAAWLEAIGRLADPATDARAPDAYAHALQAAFYAGNNAEMEKIITVATATIPGFLEKPENAPLRAKIVRKHDKKIAKSILEKHISSHKGDFSAKFDFASICLDDGDYEGGLHQILPCLEQEDIDGSFVWLAADLHERGRQWSRVLLLCERMAARPQPEARFVKRGFEAARRLGDLVTARRFARLWARMPGNELNLIDQLRAAYEDAGEFHHARLLCRWLVRQWRHSNWHLGNLVVLTARTKGLAAADRLVQALIAEHRRCRETDRAYCDAAFVAGEYSEAQRRLEWYMENNRDNEYDIGSDILLGYVKANAIGLEAAEQHFLDLASRTFQSKEALVGLAHMALRRRDSRAALDLWSRISSIFPEDTISRVEFAREVYNFFGNGEYAQRICEERLRERPHDVTMGEFYAWLLVAIGKYELAMSYIGVLKKAGGESWATLEAAIHSAGRLGKLDESWKFIQELIPLSSTHAANGFVYHLVRLLQHFERPDLAHSLLNSVRIEPHRLAWLAPYSRTGNLVVPPALLPAAQAAWGRAAAWVKDGPARRLAAMSGAEVVRALGRPRHEHPVVHIVNKFEQARGGSELHALDVAARIGRYARVELWAPEMPHPDFTKHHDVQAIDQSRGRAPFGGVIVIIGVYFPVEWIVNCQPSRVICLYNTFESPDMYRKIEQIFRATGVSVELIFCSDLMRTESGLPGIFEPSPIDIDLFKPPAATPPRPFTLGRHSRDVPEKHHPQDGDVYRAVSEAGGRSIVLGGTCMRPVFGTVPDLDLRPARAGQIVEFLQSLDVYYYRTSTWVEPWGRVVIEAMACERAVLVHDVGGYAQVIRHEENGLLFHTTQEAARLIRRLAGEPQLRERLGKAARASTEELLGQANMDRLVLFYLLDP